MADIAVAIDYLTSGGAADYRARKATLEGCAKRIQVIAAGTETYNPRKRITQLLPYVGYRLNGIRMLADGSDNLRWSHISPDEIPAV